MSSFFPRVERSYLERFVINVLKKGQTPEHVAFIMDGNRRYAERQHMERAIGHSKGFEKLAEALSWCRDLGIKQATVYAFSIENFKRSQEEVHCLMELFRQQFAKLLEEFDRFVEYDICVRFFGKLDLLPDDIREAIAKIVLKTRKHSSFHLNVALSYTSREEISNAITELSNCVKAGELESHEITDQLLSNAMYSSGLSDPDILLRTSGEVRLSDFLLWQTSFSYVSFVDDLWPDLSIWSFFKVILQYQLHIGGIRDRKRQYEQYLEEEEYSLVKNLFLEQSRVERFEDFLAQRSQRQSRCVQRLLDARLAVHHKMAPNEL